MYADYIHQKKLELEINDKLQLLELALWVKNKQLIRSLLAEIEEYEEWLEKADKVEIAICFMNCRQKLIQDYVADITADLIPANINHIQKIMERDLNKVNIDDGYYCEDGESVLGKANISYVTYVMEHNVWTISYGIMTL